MVGYDCLSDNPTGMFLLFRWHVGIFDGFLSDLTDSPVSSQVPNAAYDPKNNSIRS